VIDSAVEYHGRRCRYCKGSRTGGYQRRTSTGISPGDAGAAAAGRWRCGRSGRHCKHSVTTTRCTDCKEPGCKLSINGSLCLASGFSRIIWAGQVDRWGRYGKCSGTLSGLTTYIGSNKGKGSLSAAGKITQGRYIGNIGSDTAFAGIAEACHPRIVCSCNGGSIRACGEIGIGRTGHRKGRQHVPGNGLCKHVALQAAIVNKLPCS